MQRCAANPMFRKAIRMKKLTALLLSALLLLSMTACGGKDTPTSAATVPSDANPSASGNPAPTESQNLLGNDIVQLVSNDDVSVHIVHIEDNAHTGMQLRLQCENKTDRTLLFSWDMVSVCGFMYDPFWAEEVAAGKTANSTVYLDTYELEQMDVASVDEISFTLRVVDSENWMEPPLVEEVCTVYPTGLNADSLVLPSRAPTEGQVVLADNDDLRFVVEWADEADASAYTVYVYMENKTDRNLMYAWDLVSVNEVMVDPFWAVSVAAGKKACSEVTFYRSELAENGITDVENIEFTLLVSDYDDWEADYLLEETYTYQP